MSRKALTTKQKARIIEAHKDGWTIHQLCQKYGKSFYTIKDIVQGVQTGNDNAQKIALANKALVKADTDPLTAALKDMHKNLVEKIPNARRVILDIEAGEAAVEVVSTYRIKVTT